MNILVGGISTIGEGNPSPFTMASFCSIWSIGKKLEIEEFSFLLDSFERNRAV